MAPRAYSKGRAEGTKGRDREKGARDREIERGSSVERTKGRSTDIERG